MFELYSSPARNLALGWETEWHESHVHCHMTGSKRHLKRNMELTRRTDTVALRVPAHAPWLARRSLVHRVTRMTCHAPVRTGGAVGAGWDLD